MRRRRERHRRGQGRREGEGCQHGRPRRRRRRRGGRRGEAAAPGRGEGSEGVATLGRRRLILRLFLQSPLASAAMASRQTGVRVLRRAGATEMWPQGTSCRRPTSPRSRPNIGHSWLRRAGRRGRRRRAAGAASESAAGSRPSRRRPIGGGAPRLVALGPPRRCSKRCVRRRAAPAKQQIAASLPRQPSGALAFCALRDLRMNWRSTLVPQACRLMH